MVYKKVDIIGLLLGRRPYKHPLTLVVTVLLWLILLLETNILFIYFGSSRNLPWMSPSNSPLETKTWDANHVQHNQHWSIEGIRIAATGKNEPRTVHFYQSSWLLP